MPDYAKTAAKALASIRKNGRTLAISRPNDTPDPITGEIEEGEATAGEIVAIVLPASKGTIEAFDIRLGDGLQLGRIKYILAAADGATFPPQPLDEITIDGRVYVVKGCTPLNPAGVPIIYKMGAIEK